MFDKESRRRFITGVLVKLAGGVVAVASIAGLSSALAGCSDDTQVAKYGPLIDMKPVVKYGPTFDMKVDTAVAPKYGINDAKVEVSGLKYGINVDVK
jgi:hypothetical protein